MAPRRIALHVAGVHTHAGYLGAVSGHLQVPMMTAKLLAEHGHEITMLTTQPRPGCVVPPTLPPKVRVVGFADGSRIWPSRKPDLKKSVLHVLQLARHLRKERYDLVHFWGNTNSTLLAALLSQMNVQPARVAATACGSLDMGRPRNEVLRRSTASVRLFALTPWTSTETARALKRSVALIRPGLVKHLRKSSDKRENVVFWRNASRTNGADLAASAFEGLSRDFPNVQFRFAVRAHDELEGELSALAQARENIHLHLFPYPDGITLETLVERAHCCVFPFRRLSINPQYAILETMETGCPVVVSDVESNPDLVTDGHTGLVIPSDDSDALVAAIRRILTNPEEARALGRAGAEEVAEHWNWTSYLEDLERAYADLGVTI